MYSAGKGLGGVGDGVVAGGLTGTLVTGEIVEEAGVADQELSGFEMADPQPAAVQEAAGAEALLGSPQRIIAESGIGAASFGGVQSQEVIQALISRRGPVKYSFIKDAPIMAYRITSDSFEDIPEAIRSRLGAVDQTTYSPEYLRENIGSAIALQMNGDKPDFYVIGKGVFEGKYKIVGVDEVGTKNNKLFGKLTAVDGMKFLIDSGDGNLMGALKTTLVEMIKMSELGYLVGVEVVIQSPWGEQTKPAGQDAYLVFDEAAKMYYMVNSDAVGNPISYLPMK